MSRQASVRKECEHGETERHITGHKVMQCSGPPPNRKYCTCGINSNKAHSYKDPIWCNGPFNRTRIVE